MGISSYSTSPSSNTTISGINIAEGCPPSGINDAIRQMMADIATDVRPASLVTSSGTANAVVVAPLPAYTSYAAAQRFDFLPNANNNGATTINYGGGVINLQKRGGIALAPNDLISGVIAQVEHDGTRAILLNPQQYTHGADIASAATLNLDNATGDYVYVTGTTGISAITLTEGRQITTKFSGAVVITNGASLIAPGNANFTTAANDVIIWRGEASGVVRAVSTQKADGTAPVVVATQSVPTGVINPFAGSSAPTGWLLCSGAAVSRTTYAALFAIIGTVYGIGDGSTTFNLPDLRGRAIAGVDNMGGSAANLITSGGCGITGTTLGAVGGAETHTLTVAQLASHGHTVTDPGHTHTFGLLNNGPGTSATAGAGINSPGSNQTTNSATTGITIANNGSGQAHNNTQPTIMLNYIIRT